MKGCLVDLMYVSVKEARLQAKTAFAVRAPLFVVRHPPERMHI